MAYTKILEPVDSYKSGAFDPCRTIKCLNIPPQIIYIDKSGNTGSYPGVGAQRIETPGAALVIASGGTPDIVIQLQDLDGNWTQSFKARQGSIIPGPFAAFSVGIPPALRGTLELAVFSTIEAACCYAEGMKGKSDAMTLGLRAAGIVLTGAYVVRAVSVSDDGTEQGLIDQRFRSVALLIAYTKGDETSAQVRVRWSDDGVTFYQQQTNTVSAGSESLADSEYTFSVTANKSILLPIHANWIEIAAKATAGTPTGTMGIKGFFFES